MVSLASSDVTTDAENVFTVRMRCRSRDKVESLSATAEKLGNWDTGLCESANILWLKATCERRSMADMTDILQAYW